MVTIARFILGKRASISELAITLILSSSDQTKEPCKTSSSKSERRTLPCKVSEFEIARGYRTHAKHRTSPHFIWKF